MQRERLERAPTSVYGACETAAPPLKPGDLVRIKHLDSLPELNGADGVLQRQIPERGRWEVRVIGQTPKLLRNENVSHAVLACRAIPRDKLLGQPFLLRSLGTGLYVHPSALRGSILGPARASGVAALGARLLLLPGAEGPDGWRRLALVAELAGGGGLRLRSADTGLPLHPQGPSWDLGAGLGFGAAAGERLFSWRLGACDNAGSLKAPFYLSLHEDPSLHVCALSMYPQGRDDKLQRPEEGLHAELVLGKHKLLFVAVPLPEPAPAASLEPPLGTGIPLGQPFLLAHATSRMLVHSYHPLHSIADLGKPVLRLSSDRLYSAAAALVAEPADQDTVLLRSFVFGTFVGSGSGWCFGVLALVDRPCAMPFRVAARCGSGLALEAASNDYRILPDGHTAEEGTTLVLDTLEGEPCEAACTPAVRFLVEPLEMLPWRTATEGQPAAEGRSSHVVVRLVDFTDAQLEHLFVVIEDLSSCERRQGRGPALTLLFDNTSSQSLSSGPRDTFVEVAQGRGLVEGRDFATFAFCEADLCAKYPVLTSFLDFRMLPNMNPENSLAIGFRSEALNLWFQDLEQKPDVVWVFDVDTFVAGSLSRWLDLHDLPPAAASGADLLASGLDTNACDVLRSDSMWAEWSTPEYLRRIHPWHMLAAKGHVQRLSRALLDRLHEFSQGDGATAMTGWSEHAIPTLCRWAGLTWEPLRACSLSGHFGPSPEVSESLFLQVDETSRTYGTPLALHPCRF